MPKDTDFYYQNNEYLNLSNAKEFIKGFGEQLVSPEEYGFYLPPQLKKTDLTRFTEISLPLIHELFFDKKKTLSRHKREDFIEIFYQFLILKCIEMVEPTSISFTCKDAIDIGSAATASFYGFLKLLNSDFMKKDEQDFLRWLLYTPALFIRERGIDPERLNRTLSMLQGFDRQMAQKGADVMKKFGELLSLKTFQVKHL